MSKNTSIEKMSSVIEYIEANIRQKIILDDISYHVGLSKFHLNRIFKAITNRQLMGYVRNRKLAHSLSELLNTHLRIVDISTEYGFEHEQSYIRSFKNAFGISPNQFRKEKPALEITDKIDLQYIHSIGDNGMIIEPRILIKPEFKIVGTEHIMRLADDKQFFIANKVGNEFFYQYRHEIKNTVNPEIYIGLIKWIDENMEYTCYIPSLQVSNFETIPPSMSGHTIPTRKYAVFKYIGLHHPKHTNALSLKAIHQYIFGIWLARTIYTMTDRYFFESINNSIARDDYCEVDLFIPINDMSNVPSPYPYQDF